MYFKKKSLYLKLLQKKFCFEKKKNNKNNLFLSPKKNQNSKESAKSKTFYFFDIFLFLTFSVHACNTMVLTENPQTEKDKNRIYIRTMCPCSSCDNYALRVSEQTEETTGDTYPVAISTTGR